MLVDHVGLFKEKPLPGPVLDVASSDCRNGIFLAKQDLKVVCCDISAESLVRGKRQAEREGVIIETWHTDLEKEGTSHLPVDAYGGIVVFRYLHRPLIPDMRRAVKHEGIVVYETYTVNQRQFGKPCNPAFLLKPGELRDWFVGWEIIHYFEGLQDDPPRAVAQIVCRKRKSL